MRRPLRQGAFAVVLAAVSWPAAARSEPRAALRPPPAVAAVDVDEHLGRRLPAELSFTDSTGRPVRLGDLFDGQRPVVLVLAYYRCPMLCDLVLAGLSRTLRNIGWTPGREYRGLTVSIDPRDRPGAAHLKQTAVLQAVNATGPAAEAGWPFLVGGEPAIRALADTVGFRYAYDAQSEQFAHPAVAVVLTPDGRIARYLYGVDFPVLDTRLALAEAGQGRTASTTERLLLTCFRYDPASRRYGFYVSAVLKGGASAVIAAVGLFLAVLWRRDARRTARDEDERT